MPQGSSVVAMDRIGVIDDQPILYISAYLPVDIGSRILEDMNLLTQFTLGELVTKVCGLKIGSVVQTIAATLADPAFARHLDVEIGAPVLEGERIYSDESGRPVVFSDAFYRADRYRFVVNVNPSHVPTSI